MIAVLSLIYIINIITNIVTIIIVIIIIVITIIVFHLRCFRARVETFPRRLRCSENLAKKWT